MGGLWRLRSDNRTWEETRVVERARCVTCRGNGIGRNRQEQAISWWAIGQQDV